VANQPDDPMVLLVTVYPPEDIFIEGVIQTQGIPVIKLSESIGAIEGITFGPLAEVRIMVPRSRLEEARRVLAEVEAEME